MLSILSERKRMTTTSASVARSGFEDAAEVSWVRNGQAYDWVYELRRVESRKRDCALLRRAVVVVVLCEAVN